MKEEKTMKLVLIVVIGILCSCTTISQKDRDAFNSNFRILDERLRVVETGLVNHLLNKKDDEK